MKIKVKDLMPNPYRDFTRCPIDRERIIRLLTSYEDSGFWGGVAGRYRPDGKVELNVGAHRLLALQESGIEEIDMPIIEFSDDDMIRDMLVENLEWHGEETKSILETVEASSNRILQHITNSGNSYENLAPWCKALFVSQKSFDTTMGTFSQIREGVLGQSIISRYLKGKLSRDKIDTALKVLKGEVIESQKPFEYDKPIEEGSTTEESEKEEDATSPKEPEKLVDVSIPISREASELFVKANHARAFVDTITRDINCRAVFSTKAVQLIIAEEIVAENDKLTASIIIDVLLKKAQERIDTATKLTSTSKFADGMSRMGNRTKILLSEANKQLKRAEDLPDFTQQRVLTELHVRTLINNYHNLIYIYQNKKEELIKYFGSDYDEQCFQYDCFPAIFTFDNPKKMTKVDTEVEDIPEDDEWDKEDEKWLTNFLSDKTATVDEND